MTDDMIERVARALADAERDRRPSMAEPFAETLARAAIAATGVEQLQDFADWVDCWVSNPVTSYSVYAIEGLFGMTREKLAAMRQSRETEG